MSELFHSDRLLFREFEIIGRTAQDNLASVKVLENIGMKFWKLAPCEGIENSIYYKITADEFN